MKIAAGRVLGSYEILAPLGAGGMGEVYPRHAARPRSRNQSLARRTRTGRWPIASLRASGAGHERNQSPEHSDHL